jgi:hypothetical protein
VTPAQVLHERMPCDDRLRGLTGSQSAHRSESVFELAVIGFDRIVGMLFNVMPRRRDQLLEHGRVDRGASVTTSLGVTLNLVSAPWKNRRAVAASRFAETSTSMTCPFWSIARYTYRQTPLTFTYVSSTTQRSPDAWRANLAASDSSGVNRCTQPVHGDVVDRDPALDQELLDVAIGQAVAQIPANRHHDHFRREPEPSKRRGWRGPRTTATRRPHTSSLP